MYWRFLFRKDTWREARFSLKRAFKDKRARRYVLRLSFLLILPIIVVLYAIVLFRTWAIFFVPFVIPVLWWMKRREKQDEALLKITPRPQATVKELTEEERKAVRRYLSELAVFYAVMVDRAGSEGFLKEKILPEGVVVTSRRTHIDLLQAYGLWERMDRRDRELVMLPDGHWEREQINQISFALEQVRVLRWILRKDFFLSAISLKLNPGVAHELVQQPDNILNGEELADIAMLREARDHAHIFFMRCWAEGISRSYFQVENKEAVEWAHSISGQLKDKQNEDIVLDEKLVSECSEIELRQALLVSSRRRDLLVWTISILDSGKIPEWKMSVLPPEESFGGLNREAEKQQEDASSAQPANG